MPFRRRSDASGHVNLSPVAEVMRGSTGCQGAIGFVYQEVTEEHVSVVRC